MVELGLIGSDERVELINGAIVKKMSQKPPHSRATNKLARILSRAYSDDNAIRNQSPIALSDRSEPEPDLLVARESDDAYARRHPEPKDTLLIVEVADTTLLEDRRDKVPMYLAAGVPEVWLLDIPNRRLLRYGGEGGDLLVPVVLGEGDELPIGRVTVGDLLP